jgi:hypothetical protein
LGTNSPSNSSQASRTRRLMPCLTAMKNPQRYLLCRFLDLSCMINCVVRWHLYCRSSTSALKLWPAWPAQAGPSSMMSSSSRIEFSCRRPPVVGLPCSSMPTGWAMKASRRHCTGCTPPSSCRMTCTQLGEQVVWVPIHCLSTP